MRIALGLEYDGTHFHGWQRQSKGAAEQTELEAALSYVADAPVAVQCAGRTDAGVHADCQVVHFDAPVQRSPRAWLFGTNTQLPRSIAVRWAQPVAEDFHARFSARARRYVYSLINRPSRPARLHRFAAWEARPLELTAMQQGAVHLLGEHDFTSFRTVACQARSPVRSIRMLCLHRDGDLIRMEIEANAFLHHMVRNIMGSLLTVGRGEQPPEWIAEVLAARDRARAGVTAAAAGLLFVGPRYPREWGLPDEVCLP
ncbi:MAG: tRNA pseudouridine(38-40) synthase TruA [Lysobacterales bacterium]